MTERGFGDSPEGDPSSGGTAATSQPAHAPVPPFGFNAVLQIADTLPVMVAYVDRGEVYRFCNQPIADWFERPRKDILGRTLVEVMGEAAYALRKGAIAAALGGERQFFAAEFQHPTRGFLYTQAEYVPQLAADGAVEGVVMIVQDITEQRAAEMALRESEARFRRIANSAPAPVWVTRADRTRDFINDAYADFLGLPYEEARAYEWRLRIHPDDHDRIVAESVAGEASGLPFTLEARYRNGRGEYRWLRSVSQPRFDGEGHVVGFIGVATDVTVAKEAELDLRRLVDESSSALQAAQDQLRQSQKMEALGQLTGGIAHDFNNLLTVVVGGLDLIVRRSDDEKILRYARNALTSAERGARLTAQLLAFSRVQRLEVRPTRIARLVEEMRPILRNVLGPGIEKRIQLDDDTLWVMADPTQVEVAILNLAINARDAMPTGGSLDISTRRIEMGGDSELSPGEYLELTIADTGEGMAPEVSARAFEPFFTTKDVGKGTGLGLSMVYGMTRQSGGTVRIESEAGKGTRVRLYFRVVDGEDVEAGVTDAVPTDDMSPHTVRVLVVDDDADVREFLAGNLAEYGYAVEQASDGPSALAAFDRRRPDVLVLDYLMPGMTGAEVAQTILAKVPAQKVLFVSGYSETEAIKSAAPQAALLAKPFRPEALDQAIRQLCAG